MRYSFFWQECQHFVLAIFIRQLLYVGTLAPSRKWSHTCCHVEALTKNSLACVVLPTRLPSHWLLPQPGVTIVNGAISIIHHGAVHGCTAWLLCPACAGWGWCSVWLLAACGSSAQLWAPCHSKGRPCRAGEFEGPALYQQISRWRFRENAFIDAKYSVSPPLFLPYPSQCFAFLVSVFLFVSDEISIATSLAWGGRKPGWISKRETVCEHD